MLKQTPPKLKLHSAETRDRDNIHPVTRHWTINMILKLIFEYIVALIYSLPGLWPTVTVCVDQLITWPSQQKVCKYWKMSGSWNQTIELLNNNLWSNGSSSQQAKFCSRSLHLLNASLETNYTCAVHIRCLQACSRLLWMFSCRVDASLELVDQSVGMFVWACDSPRILKNMQIKHGQKLCRKPFYRWTI